MPRSRPALELKGRMLSVTRLRVLDPDPAAIAAQIAALAEQMPQAVRGMAAVIDCELEADLPALLRCLREAGMQPLGVSEGPLAETARSLGLAVLPPPQPARGRERTDSVEIAESAESAPPSPAAPLATPTAASAATPTPAPDPEHAPTPAPAPVAAIAPPPAATRPARIINESVRSGQRIIVEDADLIVIGTVNAGAEIIADGCIHVYGSLRGRAIAGARGNEAARIFCRKLEAELVAIAGIYAVAEEIAAEPIGGPAQVRLQEGQLRIEACA